MRFLRLPQCTSYKVLLQVIAVTSYSDTFQFVQHAAILHTHTDTQKAIEQTLHIHARHGDKKVAGSDLRPSMPPGLRRRRLGPTRATTEASGQTRRSSLERLKMCTSCGLRDLREQQVPIGGVWEWYAKSATRERELMEMVVEEGVGDAHGATDDDWAGAAVSLTHPHTTLKTHAHRDTLALARPSSRIGRWRRQRAGEDVRRRWHLARRPHQNSPVFHAPPRRPAETSVWASSEMNSDWANVVNLIAVISAIQWHKHMCFKHAAPYTYVAHSSTKKSVNVYNNNPVTTTRHSDGELKTKKSNRPALVLFRGRLDDVRKPWISRSIRRLAHSTNNRYSARKIQKLTPSP